MPTINGKVHHFYCHAIHNGMAILSTPKYPNSYWEHVSGECVHGEMQGHQLQYVGSLQHMKAEQAARVFPEAEIAISQPNFIRRLILNILNRTALSKRGLIPPHIFPRTFDEDDTRRERLDRGIGIWWGDKGYYCSMEYLAANDNAIITTVNRLKMIIFVDPVAKMPHAIYTEANSFEWKGNAIYLNTREIIRDGQVYHSDGNMVDSPRPMQMFTRWYGFSFTFPNCVIIGKD